MGGGRQSSEGSVFEQKFGWQENSDGSVYWPVHSCRTQPSCRLFLSTTSSIVLNESPAHVFHDIEVLDVEPLLEDFQAAVLGPCFRVRVPAR